MTDENPTPPSPPSLDPYYRYVGQIANEWAKLESAVNIAIWAVGKIDQRISACITANIYSFPARMNALISIAQLRGADDKIIGKLEDFKNKSSAIGRSRNRAVHDPWVFMMGLPGEEFFAPTQFTITAAGKKIDPPEYGGMPKKFQEFEDTIKRIRDHRERFEALRKVLYEQTRT